LGGFLPNKAARSLRDPPLKEEGLKIPQIISI
jgi:hypothetical protein